MKKMISAGIVVFRDSEKQHREYLLLKYDAGHWDLPKGKQEGDESLEQTALRELDEEAGISAEILPGFQESFSYFFTDYDGQKAFKEVYFFVGRARLLPAVRLSHEHTEYAWLPYDEALERLTYANARHLLENTEKFLG